MIGRVLVGRLSTNSITIDPEQSVSTEDIISRRPKLLQSSLTEAHSKKMCHTSSAARWHIGHAPLTEICLLASINLRGIIPCSIRKQKIWTLRGTWSFQTTLQVDGEAELPCLPYTFAWQYEQKMYRLCLSAMQWNHRKHQSSVAFAIFFGNQLG